WRHRPEEPYVITSAAWDGPGRCFAVTSRGIVFYNGTEWQKVPADPRLDASGVRAVSRLEAGKFMLCGANSTIAIASDRGVTELLQGADPSVELVLGSGSLSDLAVCVGSRRGVAPCLYACSGGRWLKPIETDLERVSALARVDDAEWLLAGRRRDKPVL